MIAKRYVLGLLTGLAFALSAASADEMRGVINRVDTDKKELLIEARGRGMRGEYVLFSLQPETKVQAGRQAAQLSELTPGRRVRVDYETRGGKRVATVVTLTALVVTAPAPASPSADKNTVAGTLRRIDFTDREIVIVGPGKDGKPAETTLEVAQDAIVTKEGKVIAFDDLKEEEKVAVQVEMKGEKRVAKAIDVGVRVETAGNSKIERIRDVLKKVDEVLQQIEQRRKNP